MIVRLEVLGAPMKQELRLRLGVCSAVRIGAATAGRASYSYHIRIERRRSIKPQKLVMRVLLLERKEELLKIVRGDRNYISDIKRKNWLIFEAWLP